MKKHKPIPLKDRVIVIKKMPTWLELLTALKPEEDMVISAEDANYVRTEISSTIKLRYPQIIFKTRSTKEDGKGYLIITRIK